MRLGPRSPVRAALSTCAARALQYGGAALRTCAARALQYGSAVLSTVAFGRAVLSTSGASGSPCVSSRRDEHLWLALSALAS